MWLLRFDKGAWTHNSDCSITCQLDFTNIRALPANVNTDAQDHRDHGCSGYLSDRQGVLKYRDILRTWMLDHELHRSHKLDRRGTNLTENQSLMCLHHSLVAQSFQLATDLVQRVRQQKAK